MRLKKDEVEKLGAEAFVVVALDVYRTKVFKEENSLLSKYKGPFSKEKSLVFGTALSDPAGYASALYGVSRKCMDGGLVNHPCWFVIDRTGTLTYAAHPLFTSPTTYFPTSYVKDVDLMLEALKNAAR